MDPDLLLWLLVASAAVHVIAVIVLVRAQITTRRLHEEILELRRARDRAAETSHEVDGRPAVALVINASKPEADAVARLVHSACSRSSLGEPLVLPTTPEDPGGAMAREALDAGARVVIAAGGDGTVRAVAAHLTGTEAALGVVPMGTGNLFARNIGLPHHDLEACVDQALHGRPHRVDTLELMLEHPDGTQARHSSLVIAGGGLDAEVMSDTRDALKARAGWLAYGEAGMRHVTGRRRTLTVALDDQPPHTHKVRSVLLANCGMLQAGMVLVPSAQFDDGVFDTALFSPRHALDWAKIVAKTITRSSADIPVMTVRQSHTGRLSMTEPMPFQIDGDPVGDVVGVEASIRPASLRVHGVATSGWTGWSPTTADPADDWEPERGNTSQITAVPPRRDSGHAAGTTPDEAIEIDESRAPGRAPGRSS